MMVLEKKPFTPYRLEEEKKQDKSIVLPVRINKKLEQPMINEIKKLLNIKSDGKALKVSARVGLNVLQATLGSDILGYLCKDSRDRLSDYENFILPKK